MATCPRCKTRFRFRSLQPEKNEPAPPPDQPRASAPSRPVPEKRPPSPPAPRPSLQQTAEQTEDDPLPPGAVIPDADYPGGRDSEASQTSPEGTGSQGVESGRTDSQGTDPQPTNAGRKIGIPGGEDAKPRNFADRIREATSGAAGLFTSAGENEAQDIPWERPDKYGLWGGLYHTVLRVLFGAPRFFAALSAATAALTRPVLFYIILGMFQTVAKLVWFRTVDPSITDPRVQELLSSAAEGISVPMTLLLAPGLLVIQLFLYSGLFYLMLRLVQPERTVFSTVLRVVAYSSAPMVLSLVPFLGPVVAPVWFAVCCFIGCKYALKIGWHQAALALVPLYLIAFAIAMQLVQRLLAQG